MARSSNEGRLFLCKPEDRVDGESKIVVMAQITPSMFWTGREKAPSRR